MTNSLVLCHIPLLNESYFLVCKCLYNIIITQNINSYLAKEKKIGFISQYNFYSFKYIFPIEKKNLYSFSIEIIWIEFFVICSQCSLFSHRSEKTRSSGTILCAVSREIPSYLEISFVLIILSAKTRALTKSTISGVPTVSGLCSF